MDEKNIKIELTRVEWQLIMECLKTTVVVSQTSSFLENAPILRSLVEEPIENLVGKLYNSLEMESTED